MNLTLSLSVYPLNSITQLVKYSLNTEKKLPFTAHASL